MAESNPTHCQSCDPFLLEVQDQKTQRAVLSTLLDEHPTPLTLDELILVLHADPERGDPGHAGEQAVRELVAAGLLNRNGNHVLLTRAALYFARLRMS